MNQIRLQDIIDVRTMQEIQDGFSNVTGMAALTVDIDGNPFTKLSNPCDFCMKHTRQTSLGAKRCEENDAMGGKMAYQSHKAATYTCHAGLTDFAAPIVVNGQQIGSIIGGQVLPEPMDEAKVRKIAREIGIDENEYVKAAKKVKVLSRKEIETAADFLHTLGNVISNMAYKQTSLNAGSAELKGTAHELGRRISEIEDLISANSENNKKLFANYDELNRIADESVKKVAETKETVKVIQDIAMNTRILGFNASIEASRSKESGKGFGVIAQEVRSLADVSKQSADKIVDTIQAIGTDTDDISGGIKSTADIVNKNMEYAEQISSLLNEVLAIASKMK